MTSAGNLLDRLKDMNSRRDGVITFDSGTLLQQGTSRHGIEQVMSSINSEYRIYLWTERIGYLRSNHSKVMIFPKF